MLIHFACIGVASPQLITSQHFACGETGRGRATSMKANWIELDIIGIVSSNIPVCDVGICRRISKLPTTVCGGNIINCEL